MIFGKHINRYYLKYALWLLLGLVSLVAVDFLQLEIPKLYGALINGMNLGYIQTDAGQVPFDMNYVLDSICMPMVWIILLWCSAGFCGASASSAPLCGWKRICVTGCSTMPRT